MSKRETAAAHQLLLGLALEVLLGTPPDVSRLAAYYSLSARVSTYEGVLGVRAAT